jgi:hypothetical protein
VTDLLLFLLHFSRGPPSDLDLGRDLGAADGDGNFGDKAGSVCTGV